MVERDKIHGAVLRAIEQANELSVSGSALGTEESAVLLGEGSGLDSMGFVNFVVALEEEMNRLTDRPLDLVEKINAAEAHGQPISTVGQLTDFLCNVAQS
jgi:acyl carrier protein